MSVLNSGMTKRPTEQDHIFAINKEVVERMIGLKPVGRYKTAQNETCSYMVIRR